jgi:hypothetical protein
VKKPSTLPTYDPAKDGNRFEWIIKQAAVLHEQQSKERMNRPRYDPLTGKPINTQRKFCAENSR